jgi:DNA-binding response OmpR family regulator
LRELCLHDENIVERRFLLRKYWDNTGLIYSRSLDTYIAKLRKYLETDPSVQIITVKGLGYKLQWGNAKLAIKTGSFFAL